MSDLPSPTNDPPPSSNLSPPPPSRTLSPSPPSRTLSPSPPTNSSPTTGTVSASLPQCACAICTVAAQPGPGQVFQPSEAAAAGDEIHATNPGAEQAAQAELAASASASAWTMDWGYPSHLALPYTEPHHWGPARPEHTHTFPATSLPYTLDNWALAAANPYLHHGGGVYLPARSVEVPLGGAMAFEHVGPHMLPPSTVHVPVLPPVISSMHVSAFAVPAYPITPMYWGNSAFGSAQFRASQSLALEQHRGAALSAREAHAYPDMPDASAQDSVFRVPAGLFVDIEGNDMRCSICWQDYDDDEGLGGVVTLVTMSCGHVHLGDCLGLLRAVEGGSPNAPLCPACRQDMVGSQVAEAAEEGDEEADEE